MSKARRNPGHPAKGKVTRKRVNRRPRPATVMVYQVHCKACKKRYELAYTGEVKFCTWCASDQIDAVKRTREMTREEKAQRSHQMNISMMNMVGQFFGGLFGFPPPRDFAPVRPNGVKPSSDLESELLKEGYRKLAVKYHPDKGGDPEKMKELNRLKEKLGL